MRRLLSFDCAGYKLAATLDGSGGSVGVLMVTGGTQTRIGSHRMSERLALTLARQGIPCLRFDRRGVGDSEGADPGFRGSGPDIQAATSTFREECPGLERIVGLGLCDGGTALALFGGEAGLAALILVNPWLVEAQAGAPPPAAIRRHYKQQLLSPSAWRRLLTGDISYRKALKGFRRAAAPTASPLAAQAGAALERSALPVQLILARGDATAIAAEAEWRKLGRDAPKVLETDSHTFAGPGDDAALREAVLAALARLS
jgi:exosortase A-associated hydrolase 1